MTQATSTRIVINDVRLAFPKLAKAEQVNGEGDPRFSAAFLMEVGLAKTAENIAKIEAATKKAATDKWGEKAPAILEQIKLNNKLALQDGNRKAELQGYASNYFVNAGAQASHPPTLVDGFKNEISRHRNDEGVIPAEQILYAGCRVNAIITIWAQDNKHGKRINASLNGVQFAGHDVPFGGSAPAAAEEFEMVETPAWDGSELA